MRALPLALLALTASCAAGMPDGLADAIAARSLLGPDVWARVVRLEKAKERGLETRTIYPSTTYALVFELSGILWFYCDADGTQSLSTRLGSVEADKLDPGPLFKAISPRFADWEWSDGPSRTATPARVPPPNACFIECLSILRQRAAVGAETLSPRLLVYYVDTPSGRVGHTVLVFATQHGVAAVDPESPLKSIRIPALEASDAREVARFLRGRDVAAARELPLDAGAPLPESKWAALAPAGPSAG